MVRSLLPLLILVSFLVPCLCQPTHLINCLIHQNINNFTTQIDSIVYYSLLKYSLQNLQFTGPLLPKPVAIILPESVEQLVRVVSCCTSGPWEIRVRCGGHSYEGTSSVSFSGAPFVIIDMMNLNQVLVDAESETAWVEGGATLGETYYAIAAQSSNTLGFPAGACPTVGVGGHISGGGIGFMSRKYGLAADNVVDALLVDADGRLLDRKSMGEDVFWAIRGGGGGVWGIVYAWKIKLVKVPQIVTAFMIPRSNKTHVAQLFQKWQYVASSESDVEFYLSVLVRAGLLDISATFAGFYLGPRNQLVSILTRVFPELGVREEDCKEMNWIQSILYFSSLKSGSSVSDLKNRYLHEKSCLKAKSDYVRTPISIDGINIALDMLEKEPKGYLYIEPYGGMMQNISSESIAFPHRKGNLYVIQYRVEWEEEDNIKGEKYIDWIRGFYDAMTPYVSWGPRAAYVNYMDLDLGIMESGDQADDAIKKARVWGEKYFLNNYERLVKAKTLIDPRNVFNHQQGIPPSKGAQMVLKREQHKE